MSCNVVKTPEGDSENLQSIFNSKVKVTLLWLIWPHLSVFGDMSPLALYTIGQMDNLFRILKPPLKTSVVSVEQNLHTLPLMPHGSELNLCLLVVLMKA